MVGLKEIVITLLIFFLLFHKDIFSYYKKQQYKNIDRGETKKVNVKSINSIPKVIYKTGIDDYRNIPGDVYNVFRETIKLNPEFKIKYYSDKDSRDFIKNNFENEILLTYDKLIPGAYKADLFRYCILYKNGGIYSDLTQRFTIPFNKLIDLEKDNLYLVKDIEHYKINGEGSSKGIQISFMVSRPGNEIFLKAIKQIVKNANDKYYGDNPLHPTGPTLFYNILQDYKGDYKMELKETGKNKIVNDKGETVIISKINNHQSVILRNRDHYTILWRNRRIYKV
jgi:mannosyltransferase OCH1-like enzyme